VKKPPHLHLLGTRSSESGGRDDLAVRGRGPTPENEVCVSPWPATVSGCSVGRTKSRGPFSRPDGRKVSDCNWSFEIAEGQRLSGGPISTETVRIF